MFGMSAALAIWFSGYSISTEDLMDWIQWTPKCSYLYWVTGTLMYEEFSFLPDKQKDFILGKYKYDNMSLVESYRNLGITLVVIQIAILYLVLRQPESRLRHDKKALVGDKAADGVSTSTPLIPKNRFHLTSDEEAMVNEFFGPRDSSSMVEIYDRPPVAEHTIPDKDRATLSCR
jgi:hypothetical protein